MLTLVPHLMKHLAYDSRKEIAEKETNLQTDLLYTVSHADLHNLDSMTVNSKPRQRFKASVT